MGAGWELLICLGAGRQLLGKLVGGRFGNWVGAGLGAARQLVIGLGIIVGYYILILDGIWFGDLLGADLGAGLEAVYCLASYEL